MAWDLAKAMAKKGEFESARLADFEVRQRARTFRLMAARIGANPGGLVRLIAQMDDEAILRELAGDDPDKAAPLAEIYAACGSEARAQLIEERGDPTPYRLL